MPQNADSLARNISSGSVKSKRKDVEQQAEKLGATRPGTPKKKDKFSNRVSLLVLYDQRETD